MRIPRLPKRGVAREPAISVGDPRLSESETVSTFEDQATAIAWRDQLRALGVPASLTADHPLDRFGRGDIFLVVPSEYWSQATEIVDNLE